MASKMIQNNFTGGELSPTLFGRSDLQAYYKGCASAENFVIAKEGSLRKRHGIASFRRLTTPYDKCAIFPYKFDRTQGGFLLAQEEASQLKVTYYSKMGEEIDTILIDDYSGSVKALQAKQVGDQVWLSNGSFFTVVTITDNSSLSVKAWKQLPVPDAVVYNSSMDIATTHWAITRSNNNSGKTINYGVIAVKDSVNSDTSKGSCSWSTTWTAGQYIDVAITVDISDLTRWDYFIVAKRAGGTYGELTRFYTDDTPDGRMYINSEGMLSKAYQWANGKWYDKEEKEDVKDYKEVTITHYRFTFRDENHAAGDAVYGQTDTLGEGFTNPLCVDCFQQRRVFANAETDDGKFPMTLWFSEAGNLNNFYSDRPANDDDPFSPTIATTGPAFIRWIMTYQEMMILFTDAGLFSVGFSQQSGFSASSCRISKFSELDVSPTIPPLVTDAGVVFVAGDNKTVFTAAYDLQENMLKPINRSVLVEHLTRTSQIVAIALQEYPDNVVWVVTDDGKFATFTFERTEEVYAWSHGRIEDHKVIDIIAPGTCEDSKTDRTYGDLIFVVENTQGEQYLAKANSSYIDIIGEETMPVTATLTTLRPESQERTILGLKKNVKDVLVRVYDTGALSVKALTGEEIDCVSSRQGGLCTGEIKIMPRGFINDAGQMTIVSRNNSPCEILQIITSVEVASE